nr:MAG TPA: hypothetical protein [Caudoviricetes sp.]
MSFVFNPRPHALWVVPECLAIVAPFICFSLPQIEHFTLYIVHPFSSFSIDVTTKSSIFSPIEYVYFGGCPVFIFTPPFFYYLNNQLSTVFSYLLRLRIPYS